MENRLVGTSNPKKLNKNSSHFTPNAPLPNKFNQSYNKGNFQEDEMLRSNFIFKNNKR